MLTRHWQEELFGPWAEQLDRRCFGVEGLGPLGFRVFDSLATQNANAAERQREREREREAERERET